MRYHTLLIVGIALAIAGCAEKEQPAPEAPAEAAEAVSEAVEEAVSEEMVEEAADATLAVVEDWRNEELLDHMHAHAEHLDDLNYALDDGNLERATTAAYWLAQHQTLTGLPPELQSYVDGMRDAATAVEEAADLDAARAAAEKIGAQCQACHAATDVVIQ